MSQLYAKTLAGGMGLIRGERERASSVSSVASKGSSVASTSSAGDGSVYANSHLKGEDAAIDFANKRDALVSSIEVTSTLVSQLSAFNDEKWTVQYPHEQLGFVDSRTGNLNGDGKPIASGSSPSIRRTASEFVGSSSSHGTSDSAPSSPTASRPSFHSRAFSSIAPSQLSHQIGDDDADTSSVSEEPSSMPSTPARRHAGEAASSHPLAIDLRMGAPGSTSVSALMENLSHATIAQLLARRFDSAKQQLNALHSRVRDNQSRILVTGDLNAGKSTFVNALLRRDILPTDQQPMTSVFCEVLDAQAHNDGKEEVHAIMATNLQKYSRADTSTYEKFGLDQLEEIATDEDQRYGMVKVYLEDSRAPISSTPLSVVNHDKTAHEEASTNDSFIRNGIVSISLIDGPGLNRDNTMTMSLFARQSELDVIVFVLTAANHFTESAQNFLRTAALDKAYLFIVCNKWKGIKDKERARRKITDQIRLLSPKTWENRHELVHYVEAESVVEEVRSVQETGESLLAKSGSKVDDSFPHLEESLRSFLLLKRSISKLAPAKTYLANLLSNLETVAEYNILAADKEFEEAEKRLSKVKPVHEKLEREREIVEESVNKEEEERVDEVSKLASKRLSEAVENVKDPATATSSKLNSAMLPEYPGIFGIWDWALEVKQTLLDHLDAQVILAEEDARAVTIKGVQAVTGELATRFLPSAPATPTSSPAKASTSTSVGASSALPQRVFRPEIMFSKRRSMAVKKRKTEPTSAIAVIPSLPHEIDITFFDLFDIERILALGGNRKGKALDANGVMESATSALSLASLGVGAVTMFGTRVVGVRSVVEAVTAGLDIVGSKAARKWAGPIAFGLTVGLALYIIHDLPRAIPHNIGLKLHSSLTAAQFSSAESERISKEVRKVMRLAGWDLRERFRAALESSERDRKEVESKLEKAREALEWLEDYEEMITRQRGLVQEVTL